MMTRCFAVFAAVATLASVGCGKKEPTHETPSTTAASAIAATTTATPAIAPAATTGAATTAAAAAGGKLALAGTCTTKAGARVLGCAEYYGKLPEKIEETCKKDEGTFLAGATPCSTTAAIGKCEPKDATVASSKTEVSYKTSVGDAKGSCEALGNTWTPLTAAADPKKKK